MEKQSSVAKVLRFIGIAIIIGGLILLFILGSQSPEGGLYWGGALSVLFYSIVIGMLFIGFSEIIALLQKIYGQLHQERSELSASSSNVPKGVEQKNWYPSPHDLEGILELYQDKNVREIKASPYEDYCVVQIEGEDHIEVVELGGFKPRKVSADSAPELVNDLQKWFNNSPSS
ncbi:hypothetical protein [Mesobacillus thioparans]|uniref:hypothetical protein n=1 Tax=Mesobacillus thioparans TaxID=370439 RepID=UPI0039EFBC28